MYVDRWGWPAFVFVPFVVHAKPAPRYSSPHARRHRRGTSAGGVPRVIEVGSTRPPPTIEKRTTRGCTLSIHGERETARVLVLVLSSRTCARPPCDARRHLTSPSLRAKPRREHYHHCVLAVQGRVQAPPTCTGNTHPPLIWIVNALLRARPSRKPTIRTPYPYTLSST
ncbi:hypothetical protein B0H13DRAFT_1982610 [Mycena leptocephala]|nr:hypothetical protein B0H13DRAFT_1982610 [Mycena leptocephala]